MAFYSSVITMVQGPVNIRPKHFFKAKIKLQTYIVVFD